MGSLLWKLKRTTTFCLGDCVSNWASISWSLSSSKLNFCLELAVCWSWCGAWFWLWILVRKSWYWFRYYKFKLWLWPNYFSRLTILASQRIIVSWIVLGSWVFWHTVCCSSCWGLAWLLVHVLSRDVVVDGCCPFQSCGCCFLQLWTPHYQEKLGASSSKCGRSKSIVGTLRIEEGAM